MLQPSYQITAAASNKSECYQTTPGCVGGWPCNVKGRIGGFMGIWITGYGWTGLGTVTCNYAQTLFRFVRSWIINSWKWRVNIIFETTELCNEGMAPMWREGRSWPALLAWISWPVSPSLPTSDSLNSSPDLPLQSQRVSEYPQILQ